MVWFRVGMNCQLGLVKSRILHMLKYAVQSTGGIHRSCLSFAMGIVSSRLILFDALERNRLY